MLFGRIVGARKPGTLAATATALIAGLVLIGWTFDVDLLKRVPGLVAMNPMSAVAFLAGALSISLFSDKKPEGRDPVCAGIPVIVISADATRAQIKKLKNGGACDYLTKPLDIKKLIDVLDRTLQGQASDERQQPVIA